MKLSTTAKIFGLSITVLCSTSLYAQNLQSVSRHGYVHDDLLASQQTIQNQIKLTETQDYMDDILKDENEPEADIYGEGWKSDKVNSYKNAIVPNSRQIDVSQFSMPCPGYVTSPYGYRPRFRRMHKGVDLKVNIGDTIRAAFDGKIRLTKYEGGGYGNYVIVRHENGLETVYGHLSRFLTRPNQYVKAGDPIALGGNTGRSTGPHLHFETRFMGYAINPAAIFDFRNQTTHTDIFTFNKRTYEFSRDYSPNAQRAKYAAKRGSNSYKSTGSKTTYKVRRGDSLGKIAARHGVSVSEICKLNGVSKSSKIKQGKVLRIK
ncbi:MAG: M23 family metallopeptidase [Muribaculaceae bacterium]